ncbi:hypothetical protein PG987_003117 [Apiospora arundinis]
MDNVAAKERIQTIESTVHRLLALVNQQIPPSRQSRPSNLRLRSSSKQPPPWIAQVLKAIREVSSDLHKLKNELTTTKSHMQAVRQTSRAAATLLGPSPPKKPDHGHAMMDTVPGSSSSPLDSAYETASATSDNAQLVATGPEKAPSPTKRAPSWNSSTGSCGDFDYQITVDGIKEIDWAGTASFFEPPENHDFFGVAYCPGPLRQGYSYLRLSRSNRFRCPDFTRLPSESSQINPERFLTQLVEKPPTKKINYYVGPTSAFSDLLHPGEELLEPSIGRLPGINEPWCHAGDALSGTAFHREDARFYSCNLTLRGWKLWLLILPAHTQRFEAFIKDLIGLRHQNYCDQFVRHEALLIDPERLRKAEIDFKICVAGPGDIVITRPGQYHCVVNLTTCFAIAINFVLPGEKAIPEDLTVCPACGLYPLKEKYTSLRIVSHIPDAPRLNIGDSTRPASSKPRTGQQPGRKRAGTIATTDTPPKKRITRRSNAGGSKFSRITAEDTLRRPSDDSAFSAWLPYIQKHDSSCRLPSLEQLKSSAVVLRLFLATQSRSAVDYLCGILFAWRRQDSSELNVLATSRGGPQRLHTLATLINDLETKGNLNSLMAVLAKVEFANHVQTQIARERLSDQDWDLVWNDIAGSGGNREPLEHRNRRSAEWRNIGRKITRFSPGLLCLIPAVKARPYHVGYSTLTELSDEDVHRLQAIVASTDLGKQLLEFGSRLVESVLHGHDLPEYLWEHSCDNAPHELTEDDIVQSIAPFPALSKCVVDLHRFQDVPVPEGWPGTWPADPTSSYGFESPCDFCSSDGCQCRESLFMNVNPAGCYYQARRLPGEGIATIVIRASGKKGQGIFAKGPANRVLFEKGNVIGEFTGEIVPPATYDYNNSGGMVLDVEREDLPGAPVVYQIYCGKMGNWTRKINHRCHKPSAYLRTAMFSGHHCVLVFAHRDLMAGDEVTIRYSRGKQQFSLVAEYIRTPNRRTNKPVAWIVVTYITKTRDAIERDVVILLRSDPVSTFL